MNDNPNEKSSQSQNNQIIAWLEKGNTITQLEALNMFGCFRLASRIHNLRERGYNIKAEKITTHTGKIVCQYSLDK